MPHLCVQALAKVNLGLRVLYKRPDGYHEVRTILQTISLADRVELEYRRSTASGGDRRVELTCSRADLSGGENLAAQAARQLLEATGSRGVVRIHLTKRIPVGAGLGGGSSDAAAVLRALGWLLRPRPGISVLLRLAKALGSDVPFFLLGGRALGLGRGTELYPLPEGPERWMLLLTPRLEISTAQAYQQGSRDLTSHGWEDKIDRFCSSAYGFEQGVAEGIGAAPENDFEAVIFRLHPKLKQLKARLQEWGAQPALLCGSGSALFGVFADRQQALRAHHSLNPEDVPSRVVKSVGRRGFRERWLRWLKEN